MKTADEMKRADKAEFEMKRQQEKMLGLQKEKEVGWGGGWSERGQGAKHGSFSSVLYILFFFLSLFPIWGWHIKFSISTFSGLVLLLSLLVFPSCLFL